MSSILTIPCFNEASRFDAKRFGELAAELDLHFVDDGSSDDTVEVIGRLCDSAGESVSLQALPANVGKGEAVRQGLLATIEKGVLIVGFADADLATPGPELVRLVAELENSDADVVLGSRIEMLGADVDRGMLRHYLGRVFATGASQVLGAAVYDTQCGAKFFRTSDGLRRALSQPFVSRWAFDVELIGRLLIEELELVEVPLRQWHDVAGSKLSPTAMARTGFELLKIRKSLGAYRRSNGRR